MITENQIVTISNGKQVPWDEFSSWSSKKQNNALNPPAKGNRMTLEKCIEISIRQRASYSAGDLRPRRIGINNKSSKKVMTPNGEFESINAVASFYCVTRGEVCKWIKKSKSTEFYFSNPSDKSVKVSTTRKAVLTPQGRFPTMTAAALHYGVDYQTVKAWIDGTGRYAGQFKFTENFGTDIQCKNNKKVMTPQGEFESLKQAAKALGIEAGKISRWAKRRKDGEYYFT